MTHAFTRDPVDADLDRELARIEAENRRDEALDDEANAFMLRSPDAEFGRVMRQAAIRNDDLYALMFDAAREIAEKNLEVTQ